MAAVTRTPSVLTNQDVAYVSVKTATLASASAPAAAR